MTPEQKKRARPVPKASQQSKKRQKIEPVKNDTAKVGKRAVALDALPWNEVEMPDMFEDAEGFFGLEEVEGVEVIREGDTVKFVRTVDWQEIKDLPSLGDSSDANGR
jgi:ATP-dependent RNA helicase DDX24/MAK5